jgi:hypothetical protein
MFRRNLSEEERKDQIVSPEQFRDDQARRSKDHEQVRKDDNGRLYMPNRVPVSIRLANLFYSLLLTLWIAGSLVTGEVLLLGKRSGSVLLSGVPAAFATAACISTLLSLVLEILDHYDMRNNAELYLRAIRISIRLGVLLFLVAILLAMLVFEGSMRDA